MSRVNPRWVILAAVLALTAFGLVMIYSSSAFIAGERHITMMTKRTSPAEVSKLPNTHPMYLHKQMKWCVIALACLIVFYKFDYQHLLKCWWLLLPLSGISLALVYTGFGKEIGGAKRWIELFGFRFQPSEAAKFSLAIVMAQLLSAGPEHFQRFRRVLPTVIVTGIFVGMIAIEDLGTAVVIAAVVAALWFAAGVQRRHLVKLAIMGLVAFAVFVLIEPYRRDRFVIWISTLIGGEGRALTGAKGWQILNSLIAVGTGGLRGVGAGMGIQKHGYLPEIYTDFIMAHICEELGFIGAIGVILVFAALIWQGLRVGCQSPDSKGGLLALGMVLMIAVPALINLAVILNCGPTKGLALPFISYGGSSLAMNFCAMGVLMNIARHNERMQAVGAQVSEPDVWMYPKFA